MSAMPAPAPASEHQRLLAASLAGLSEWERNFLRMLSGKGGAAEVIVELGSLRDRPREARGYGKISDEADVARVRAVIAGKLRERAADLAAQRASEAEESVARNAPPPTEEGDGTALESPAADDGSRDPAPNSVRRAPSSSPPGGAGNAAGPEDAGQASGPRPSDPGELDDFGQARPDPIGLQRWQPREPVPCATCGHRFWPAGPGARFCPDHKDPRSRPADEPEQVCDVCDHVLPEDGGPCAYCARELADVEAAILEPDGKHLPNDLPSAAPARDPLSEAVLALLVADAQRMREEFAPRLVALERQVEALRVGLEQLRGMVDASGLDALDITLGAAVAGLARIGRGELPPGVTPGQLLLNIEEDPHAR